MLLKVLFQGYCVGKYLLSVTLWALESLKPKNKNEIIKIEK